MRACKFSDKESDDARKQMAVHRTDNNTTTNQLSDQQKWVVVVAVKCDSNSSVNNTNATARRQPNNVTTNQQRDQQKWAVVVAAIATVTSVATTATQQSNSDATETVMDGNGWCDGNTTATAAMEGAMATQWQRKGKAIATRWQRDGN